MLIKKDLTPFIDDKKVLKNPHKGWYWHYYDNGMKRKWYRDRLTGNEDYKEFPGLNHLYLRIDWSDIQPQPDEFDWSEVDRVMDEWSKKGYRFSFRMCCSETNETQCFATPEWLYKMGCKGTFIPPTKEENPTWWTTKFGDDSIEVFNRIVGDTYHRYWEPDYSDPLFLKYLDIFLEKFAEKYDNDPRVEFVDLGTYGNWGEGHVCFGTRKSASIETLKTHAYLHAKHFKNKFIIMNDDFITHLYDCTEEDKKELYDFCKSLGMGIRDDSIIAGDYIHRPYHTIEAPEMFDDLHIQAPVDLELGHYWSYNRDNAKDGLVIMEAARRAHATYAGFHTYPEDYLKDNYYVVEYLANRLGYWYTLHSVSANSEAYTCCPMLLETEWENMGFAPAYTPFELEIRLKSTDGDEFFIKADKFNNLDFYPNKRIKVRNILRLPENMPQGKYSVAIKMTEGETPILLALSDNIKDENDFYTLTDITIM